MATPMPYGTNRTSPAPRIAARPQESAPSRSNAASAQSRPSTGTTMAPTPNSCHSMPPVARPQLPVHDTGSSVRPKKKPSNRAAMPMSSCRDHDGLDTEQLPPHAASRASPASRPRHRQQREAQEEAEQQGRDADELLPSFLIHAAMRRSA